MVNTYTPAACDAAGAGTTASKALLTAGESFAGTTDLTFNPLARGATADVKTTSCNPGTGTCKLN